MSVYLQTVSLEALYMHFISETCANMVLNDFQKVLSLLSSYCFRSLRVSESEIISRRSIIVEK
jgi:hypothetical protein